MGICQKDDGLGYSLLNLVRYVKPSWISHGELSEDAFQLREDRTPPEEFVSFYHSKQDPDINRVKDVALSMRSRSFQISNSGGFLHLKAHEAKDEINRIREIINFKVERYPHYGMYYISDDELDLIEAKTTLVFLSDFYTCQSVMSEPALK